MDVRPTGDDLRQRIQVLERELSHARAEVEALKVARTAALRLTAWGGLRHQDVTDKVPSVQTVQVFGVSVYEA
jgi:cyclopropane fatty-acyl-phospholipid synthase-like methyltransferase